MPQSLEKKLRSIPTARTPSKTCSYVVLPLYGVVRQRSIRQPLSASATWSSIEKFWHVNSGCVITTVSTPAANAPSTTANVSSRPRCAVARIRSCRAIVSSTSRVSGSSSPASSVTSTAAIEKPSPRSSCWSFAHCGTLSPGCGSRRPAVSAGESTVGIQTMRAPSRAAISTASAFIPPTAQFSVIVPIARTPGTAPETIRARSAVEV